MTSPKIRHASSTSSARNLVSALKAMAAYVLELGRMAHCLPILDIDQALVGKADELPPLALILVGLLRLPSEEREDPLGKSAPVVGQEPLIVWDGDSVVNTAFDEDENSAFGDRTRESFEMIVDCLPPGQIADMVTKMAAD
jgi:hypothetical protein